VRVGPLWSVATVANEGPLPVDDDQHVGGFAIGMEDEAIFLGFPVNQSGSDRRWTDSLRWMRVEQADAAGCVGGVGWQGGRRGL
jgi:hypothetical protein